MNTYNSIETSPYQPQYLTPVHTHYFNAVSMPHTTYREVSNPEDALTDFPITPPTQQLTRKRKYDQIETSNKLVFKNYKKRHKKNELEEIIQNLYLPESTKNLLRLNIDLFDELNFNRTILKNITKSKNTSDLTSKIESLKKNKDILKKVSPSTIDSLYRTQRGHEKKLGYLKTLLSMTFDSASIEKIIKCGNIEDKISKIKKLQDLRINDTDIGLILHCGNSQKKVERAIELKENGLLSHTIGLLLHTGDYEKKIHYLQKLMQMNISETVASTLTMHGDIENKMKYISILKELEFSDGAIGQVLKYGNEKEKVEIAKKLKELGFSGIAISGIIQSKVARKKLEQSIKLNEFELGQQVILKILKRPNTEKKIKLLSILPRINCNKISNFIFHAYSEEVFELNKSKLLKIYPKDLIMEFKSYIDEFLDDQTPLNEENLEQRFKSAYLYTSIIKI